MFEVHIPLYKIVSQHPNLYYHESMYTEIKKWCEENELSLIKVITFSGNFYFNNEQDAILFAMVWG